MMEEGKTEEMQEMEEVKTEGEDRGGEDRTVSASKRRENEKI